MYDLTIKKVKVDSKGRLSTWFSQAKKTMLVGTTTGNEFCLVYAILQKKNVNQKILQKIY